jgi:hypothetical protein
MFDVFYFGSKPNLFGFERPADGLDHAAELSRTSHYWYIYGDNDYTGFDFDYVPVPWESTHLHTWPTQWNQFGGAYLANTRTVQNREYHFHQTPVIAKSTTQHWHTLHTVDEFDYSWCPHPMDPPYIYVFGNQWYGPEQMPTVEYRAPGATERKYLYEPRAKLPEHHDNQWRTLEDCVWDYSWVPDPGDPPYIYVFGNQWHDPTIMPTVEYHVDGATERKYIETPMAELVADIANWTVPEEINSTNIDFSWRPNPGSPPYIYHFGSDYQISTGLTYTVPGATEPRFEGEAPRIDRDKTVIEVLDIFYIDCGNDTAQARYEELQLRYPNIQKVRYANTIMDTIQRCVNRAKKNKFWVISSEYDYTNFEFAWHAEPWQTYMTHVFPSQHQKWSDTFLINKWEFERHAKWAKTLNEFPNLNFVQDQTVVKSANRYNVYYVDHGNKTSQHQFEYLRADIVKDAYIIKTRFVDNYLDTFKRIMSTAETEYVWIINSICDYSQFDFTWEPEPWQREMIHVFPSDNQERGDTFYIHVESFKKQMIELELLDWFNVINYCEDQRVNRFDIPTHQYYTDDLVSEIKKYEFKTPYVTFTNQKDLKLHYAPCLWTRKDRVVSRITRSGATVAVPRDIKADLVSQIYDYPYISDEKPTLNEYYEGHSSPGLDIVYISNGEPDEERWYDHLCYQSNHQAKWVRGINGRTAAYQEAARQSSTPWFFAVFAKLEVLGNQFPWYEWMPDYFQEPKHYIFNSRNPVNGLEYGHQGVIAYNKKLVLSNNTPGIDFTLSQPHESVPILSGIAHYNQTPWMTWRTAFREVVKLKHFMATEPTLETEHRLDVWTTVANGDFAEWSIHGAADAVEYYAEVGGDLDKLKLSFEWDWLQKYFYKKYPE